MMSIWSLFLLKVRVKGHRENSAAKFLAEQVLKDNASKRNIVAASEISKLIE